MNVPKEGFEPSRSLRATDFKSAVSTVPPQRQMEESVRFELTEPLLVQRFSRPSQSTTLSTLRNGCRGQNRTDNTDAYETP